MKLRLIGPKDEFETEWDENFPQPAVIVHGNRVWVRAANSFSTNQMYFEQQGWYIADKHDLQQVK